MHPQLQQLLGLSVVLMLGNYTAHIYLALSSTVAILLFTIIFEHALIYFKTKHIPHISYSSLSTAIGVMVMLATPYLWVYFVVIGLGLAQKHFLTIEGRHFFNPSNFALILGMLLFYNDAHLVMGQLGDALWLQGAVIVIALAILVRVDRWMIPIGFTLFYLLLQYLFVVQYDPVLIMDEIYYRFYSVAFVLFVLFMLTDPLTTPSKYWQQLLAALLIAMGAVLLDRVNGFRVQHLFMMVFIFSPLFSLLAYWGNTDDRKKLSLSAFALFVLALSVIIFIEGKPPYYFEMDG